MPDLSNLLDTYSLRARLLPALLVVLPAGIALGLLLPTVDYQRLLAAGAMCAGVPIFAANAVRSRGRHLENELVADWGGMPTTWMLRWQQDPNRREELARRHDRLEKATGVRLPTSEEETADGAAADRIYVLATRALITRVRANRDHFDLVQRENIDYGFRRNLLAVKPIGLLVLALLLVIDAAVVVVGAVTAVPVVPVVVAASVQVLCALGWMLVVRQAWVREQADTYAGRLFETLEDPALGEASQETTS